VTPTRLRWIDVMCDQHRTTILDTRIWPENWLPGNHDDPTRTRCDDCVTTGMRVSGGTVSSHPMFDSTYDAAIHEAGHVVVYMACGYQPVNISMRSSGRPGSTAHFNVHTQRDDVDPLPGMWAGQSAILHWVDRQGLLDDAMRIDAAFGGQSDASWFAEQHVDPARLPAAWRDADWMVAECWPQIVALADALIERRDLDGPAIEAIVGDCMAVAA